MIAAAGPFVGRARELAVLHAAVADAGNGRGRLVLLAGEPGIGKTRTAEEVAAYARERSMQVLWGRCYEGEGAPAFWPWIELLRAATKRLPDDALRTALGWRGAELAHIVPELRQRLPEMAHASALHSAQGRFRLFEGVAHFLAELSAAAPLVCIIDDLHGGDRSSLLLLEFVARELRELSAVVIGTYRHGATLIGHPLTELVVEALRLPGVESLTLSGLSRAEVAELMQRMTGMAPAAALVAAVQQQTEGNPLYVGEYVRLLMARHSASALSDPHALRSLAVPDTVRAVVRQRVTPLSPPCRVALSVAAVIGRDFYADTVESVVSGGADAAAAPPVLAALDEAVAAGIIAEGLERGGRYRFAHAVMREALYEDLGSAQRVQLHRRVGDALEQRGDIDEHLAEVAHHFYQAALDTAPARAAADSAQAVTYARRAGDKAMAALAYEEAARLYRLALVARDHCGVRDDAERSALIAELEKARGAAELASSPPARESTEVDESRESARQQASVRNASPVSAPAMQVERKSKQSAASILRKDGEYWTLAYSGTVVRLKDSKGVLYLARLLRQPGQEFLAVDLAVGEPGRRAPDGTPEIRGAGLAILDSKARAEYKRRLTELREDLQEAEAANDAGRAERARAEIELISSELAAAVGLGGSDRVSGSAVERARSAVTKGIKSAIAKITNAHPSAGRYLARTVRTGTFCAYEPDPDDEVRWGV